MPSSYTWTLAAISAASVTSANGARFVFARRLNPMTGDRIFDSSHATWASGSPELEVAIRVMRTEKGSALRDLEYGIDWSQLDNERGNAAAIAQNVISAGFARYVKAGRMIKLLVQVEAKAPLLLWAVSFRDSRGQLASLEGRP
jgi:hypothetical protein